MGQWYAKEIYNGTSFVMEDGEHTFEVRQHCKACALTQVLMEYGGTVDLRGLYRYGRCYLFLKAAALVIKQEEEGHVDVDELFGAVDVDELFK